MIMEYQKNHKLDNAPNWPSKFGTRKWIKINDFPRRTYNTNSQIEFKTTMLKSNLYDYNDAYILVKESITVVRAEGTPAAVQKYRNSK